MSIKETSKLDKNNDVAIEVNDLESNLNQDGFKHIADSYIENALSNAGSWAFGTIGVEVWVQDDDHNKLIRPDGGLWVDPIIKRTQSTDSLKNIVDSNSTGYLQPSPLSPGEGLAGILWSELCDVKSGFDDVEGVDNQENVNDNRTESRRASMWNFSRHNQENVNDNRPGRRRTSLLHFLRHHQDDFIDNSTERSRSSRRRSSKLWNISFRNHHESENKAKLIWRDLHQLAEDPDQAYNERLKCIFKAGFGFAAGVIFKVDGVSGIVIYFAMKTVDMSKLQSESNEAYLRSAAKVVGATVASRELFHQVLTKRKTEEMEALGKAKQTSKKHVKEQSQTLQKNKTKLDCMGHIQMWCKKLSGAGSQPSPPTPLAQAPFLFFATFIHMLLLCGTSTLLHNYSNGKYDFHLPALAASTCLLYSLTAAPASQPSNKFFGVAISAAIGKIISYMPMTLFLRQAFAVSASIVVTACVGLTCPVASAVSIPFSGDNETWIGFGITLSSFAIAVLSATLINNWSEKKHYPMYWGSHYSRHWYNVIKSWQKNEKEKEIMSG